MRIYPLILITGATGFLGRNLCDYLAGQGHAMRALARPTSDASALEGLNIEVARGDITDLAAVQAAMHGCDQVIHAAAHFRLWGPPAPFIQTNVDGARHVLETALSAGVKRFVHVSTIIVVGPQPPGVVITEETPCRPYPTDNYAQTKFLGERLALNYANKGLPAVILRLGALYGPHGHYGFNRLFFEEFLHNWRVQVHGGRRIIFPCYVGDAAKAIEAALTRGRVGQVYNVSNPSIMHKEANQTVSRLAGRSSWRINVPGRLMIETANILEDIAFFTHREPFYPKNLEPYVFDDWRVDASKAESELGFVSTPFAEGVQQTLAWYRATGWTK
jgi:nucleoside-diphosphate-sugar epimerase